MTYSNLANKVPDMDTLQASVYDYCVENDKKIAELFNSFKTENLKLIPGCPYSELVKDKGEIKVAVTTNIPIPYIRDGYGTSRHYKSAILETAETTIKELYAKGVPAEVWADKSKAILFKKTTISLERFIRKYTLSKDKKDDEVTKMAHKIMQGLLAHELIICDTPQDYLEMFSVKTGSCMDHTGKTWTYHTPLWAEAREKYGIHPGSWYAYTQTSKGVYLRERETKKPVVRAMIYSEEPGAPFTLFGDVHYGYPAPDMGIMTRALHEAGIHSAIKGYWPLEVPFKVPAYELSGGLYCPYPFGDAVNWHFGVGFDANTKEFVFYPNDKSAPYRYDQKGWLKSTSVEQVDASKFEC